MLATQELVQLVGHSTSLPLNASNQLDIGIYMSNFEDNHADVQQEMYEIMRERKDFAKVFWFTLLISIFLHAAFLTLCIYLFQQFFQVSDYVAVISITCTTYICSLIGMGISRLQSRVDRMEMHLLTIHNEILKTQESIDSIRWKS